MKNLYQFFSNSICPGLPSLASLLFGSLIVGALSQNAQAATGPQYRGLRSEASGNTGIVTTRRIPALFINPAGLAGDKFLVSGGLGGSQGLNSVLLDYAAWASKNAKYFNDIDSLLTRLDEVDSKWAPFNQYLHIGGQHEDIAFAMVGDINYELTVAQAALTPVFGVGVRSDFIATLGRGMYLENGDKVGLALKYLYRTNYSRRLMGATNPDFYTVKAKWEEESNGIFDKISKIKVAADIAETQHGLGLNAGWIRKLNDRWSIGAALLDMPTVLDAQLVYPEINLGASYTKDFHFLPDMTHRLTTNMEWHHFLFFNERWFNWFKLGATFEAIVNERNFGYVAVGLNDGYPTFGVRAGYIAYLGYTYYVEELGVEPGQNKLSFHKLSLDVEF